MTIYYCWEMLTSVCKIEVKMMLVLKHDRELISGENGNTWRNVMEYVEIQTVMWTDLSLHGTLFIITRQTLQVLLKMEELERNLEVQEYKFCLTIIIIYELSVVLYCD